MLLFEKVCDEINATTGRSAKLQILEKYKDEREVREFFSTCFSPTINFGVILPEENAPQYTQSLNSDQVTEIFFKLCTKEPVDTSKLGIWIVKLINRNLKLGVAAGAVEKIWPMAIKTHPHCVGEPDPIEFGQGEGPESLIHHLDDFKNWKMYGARTGILVYCYVKASLGKCYFSAASQAVNIFNTEIIETDLLEAFKEKVVLIGRLFLKSNQDLNETWKVFTENLEDPKQKEDTFFQIHDAFILEDQETRLKRIESIKDYDHLSSVKPVQIPIGGIKKLLEEFKLAGDSKAYFVYSKGTFPLSKRNFLSLRL